MCPLICNFRESNQSKMKITTLLFVILTLSHPFNIYSQNISDFISVNPVVPSEALILPDSHRFQKIIEVGDPLTAGGNFPVSPDFTAYVPISGSSVNGYLSINSEAAPGGNTVLDIQFDSGSKLWTTSASQAIDFSSVGGTIANCSGTVTPWNTVISSEEFTSSFDGNGDGYRDYGWNVELNPASKTVLGKLWAMGNFAHENVVIHVNQRTVYQGADSNPGYLYKYVADAAQDLSSGSLYVYSGSKSGAGNWILLNNTTQNERNTTLSQSAAAGATVFDGIEDVEIGPDGHVYFAVKGENRVYRFQDSDPITGTTATMETYVGNMNYDITHSSGTSSVAWGSGNDNLAFDGQGNLWVNQDGGNYYIWVVYNGHTQASPQVGIFGIAPSGSESTGITFTPDYQYMFLSIQHPSGSNNANQLDAAGNTVNFDKGTSVVVALSENLGETLEVDAFETEEFSIYPNPVNRDDKLIIRGVGVYQIRLFSLEGKQLFNRNFIGQRGMEISMNSLSAGMYFCQVNQERPIKIIIK